MKAFYFACVLFVFSPSGFTQLFESRIDIAAEYLETLYTEGCSEVNTYNLIYEYSLQFLIALKYYPELNDVNIEYVFKSLKTTMSAYPSLSFLFKQKEKRKYYVAINNNPKFNGVKFEELPFNAQVGIIGHELAHVFDYENKSRFGIFKTGIGYLFTKRKQKLESKIDYIAIERGLGWQIFDFCDYVLNRSDCCPKYKNYKESIYLTPGEIYFLIYQLKLVY